MVAEDKRIRGEYYTIGNPFAHPVYQRWERLARGCTKKQMILEPFAGANNIPKHLDHLRFKSFDIAPGHSDVQLQDTLVNFPTGYEIGITNPPYLAKNSATRRKMAVEMGRYDDLYKYAVDLMLNNLDFIAAIIPESFITSGLFRGRLYAVITLTKQMFGDTDCPVCLAMWVKESTKDFRVYRGRIALGSFSKLEEQREKILGSYGGDVIFNDPKGMIGLRAVDNQVGPSIEFIAGSEIPAEDIIVSSRAFSRITVPGLATQQVGVVIERCNRILSKFRGETGDVFLTSFKGLRKDGAYRRRLDWAIAKRIILCARESV